MAQVTFVYYAAARAAASGVKEESFEAGTIAGAQAQSVARHGSEMERLFGLCSFLVAGRAADPQEFSALLGGDVRVDVLPPFAGG
ncbi:MoaD/ThiS family protein [Timonella senegalensis]|uniref:MoaD/ThiS family protein n=1 Tax=Timonella senegalensis TaxID=1465825 RepID=UPI002FDDC8A0